MLWLSLTEMCQRYGFWGISILLVLYLTQFYGYSTDLAAAVFGLFTGFGFITPVLGGYIADKWNYSYPIPLGLAATLIGTLGLASGIHFFLYPSLFFVAIGSGLFTPCIYTLLGKAYRGRDHLREVGFTIYYSAVNLGVFCSVIIMGQLLAWKMWEAMFLTGAIIQVLGYFAYRKAISLYSKEDLLPAKKQTTTAKTRLSPIEKERIVLVCIFCFLTLCFFTPYSQNSSTLMLFSLKYTNRMIDGYTMPAAWLLSSETLYLLILAFPITYFYLFLRKRNAEPSAPYKAGISLLFMGACFLLMSFGALPVPAHAIKAAVNPSYLFVSLFFMAIAELLMAPISLSLITNISPKRFTAFFVGLWYWSLGMSYYIGGFFASLFEIISPSAYFSIFAIGGGAIGILVLLFASRMKRMMHVEAFPNKEDPSL